MSRDALIEKFRNVGLERIEQMNALLVELERDPEHQQRVEELLRELHTIKGEAKMMGFADINLVAHQTENLLLAVVEDNRIVDTRPVELLFEGLDLMRTLLTKSAAEPSEQLDLTGFVDRVAAFEPQDQPPGKSDDADDPDEPGEPDHPEKHIPPEGPDDSHRDSESPGNEPPQPRQDSTDATRTRIETETADESPPSPSSSESLRIQASSSLRVDVDKLERLGDIAGETLLLSRRMDYQLGELDELRDDFRRLLDDIDQQLPQRSTRRLRELVHRLDACETALRDDSYQVNRHASRLDEQTRNLRHVPLSQVLSHYPRAVRDLADTQGKQVRLTHSLGNVDIDRTILSALSEPLLHLIRNAVDHGIESPKLRVAKGKPPEGEIELTAEYVGDAIRVELADDGRGIDPDKIRQRAVQSSYLTDEQARRMSDQEAMALIFESGFSTRDQATDVSGRGVGMDVVRRQITNIGGFIEVDSQVDEGTVFSLHLPVSSAVNSVLLFVIEQRRFALTSKDVRRVELVEKQQLNTVHGGVCVQLDDEMLPLVDWASPLQLGERDEPPDPLTVLVVRKGSRHIAVWVDDVIGKREALSRPLDDFLAGIELCRGVAVTDSGAVVPLLDVAALVERISADAGLRLGGAGDSDRRSFTAVTGHRRADRHTVLVVEDSEVTRSLIVSILQEHDYRVLQADDGHHAWKRLTDHRVDLVLTDIQMPGMDGLQLLENIRSSDDYAGLPVIMLTTLGDDDIKKRAMGLGANGYLVKLSFQEEDLLESVERHI